MSQGYRTEDVEDEEQNLEISMVTLRFLNEELRSDQRVIITKDFGSASGKDNEDCDEWGWGNSQKGQSAGRDSWISRKGQHNDLLHSKSSSEQQELAEVSYQMLSRILELNAVSFAAIPLGMIPLNFSYVSKS